MIYLFCINIVRYYTMNGKYKFLSLVLCLSLILTSLVLSPVSEASAAEKRLPETSHPYEPELDDEGEPYKYEGPDADKVKALRITFSEDTETEEGFDVIGLYGSKGQLVGQYSGRELAGKSVITPGASFYISLTSDSANEAYGYRIVSVEPLFPVTYSFNTNGGTPVEDIADAILEKSPRTSLSGRFFAGWYDNKALAGQQISFPYRSDRNITLYASWSDVPSTNIADFDYEVTNNTVQITEYHGNDTVVYIPEQAQGLPVTQISSSVFANTKVESIVIGAGITEIDSYAFNGCRTLKSITVDPDNAKFTSKDGILFSKDMKTILRMPCGFSGTYVMPETVTAIGSNAFTGCNTLTGITFSKKITSIPAKAFYYCAGLTKFTVPQSVTSIGESAFYACSKLADITLHDGISSIGEKAFTNTAFFNDIDNWENGALYIGNYLIVTSAPNTPSSYIVKDGTVGIAAYAFNNNTALGSISLPESLRFIDSYSFMGCSSLTDVTMAEGLTKIGDYAFSKCTSLKSVIIPDTVTTVGKMGVFDGCTALTSATLGKGIKSTGFNMFNGCTSLKTVVLTYGTTTIYSNTFPKCRSLGEIIFRGSEEQWKSLSVKSGNEFFTAAHVTIDRSYIWSKADINHDGKKNAVDGYYLKLLILGSKIPDEGERYCADINSDGKINAVDGFYTAQIILGNTSFITSSER